MPASVVPITASRQGAWVLLEMALPGQAPRPAGVLLVDPAGDRGYLRWRPDVASLGDDDTEVFETMEEGLRERLDSLGATGCLEWMEDTLSNALRVSQRHAVAVDSFHRVADRLFREHVAAAPVEPFRTHLPLWTLSAAAGHLGEDMVAEAEDWVPAPENLRLSADMFVAHVTGRSMEPLIPDGSLNVFRYGVVGSRQNKIVLIERLGAGEGGRYSVKKYTSRKRQEGADEWRHEAITFVPLNPEFAPWSPEEHEFRVIAEWVRTLE